MKIVTSLRESFADPDLLAHAIPGPSWSTWRALLIAGNGEKLTPVERRIFVKFTGRKREPLKRVRVFAAVAGRRAGKTQAIAAYGTYLGAVCDHRDALASGETGVLLCLAQDQRIAAKILDYVESNLLRSKILKQRFVRRTQDAIELNNNVRIEVRPASVKKLRGPTYVGIICDELAFWYIEERYAHPDVEVLAAARPGLLTTHGPLILASSPYAKRGVLWDTYHRHYGPNGAPDILVAKGTTRDFNPTVSQQEIDALLEEDPARNTAEYLAEFRADLELYISLDRVEACVGDFHELPPSRDHNYFCYCDPAGGSGEDSFAAAIAHRSDDKVIVDCVREYRSPFNPDKVIRDIAALCKSYNIGTVYGDHFGGGFPPELFRQHNLTYEKSKQVKSDQFRDLLPLLNSEGIVLPRYDRLIKQIASLERQVARSGRDSINHAPGARDDLANAVAGAALLAHRSLPGLWHAENFLIQGQAAELPRSVVALSAALVANSHGQIAAAYFHAAREGAGQILYLTDADIMPLTSATLLGVHRRINELFNQAPTCYVYGGQVFGAVPDIYCQRVISDQFDAVLGRAVNARLIDHLLTGGDLALSVALHVGANQVRVTNTVLNKFGLGFLDTNREDDVLHTAFLIGVEANFHGDRLVSSRFYHSPNLPAHL